MINIDDIRKFFRGHIVLSEPLSEHTSLRIGGPADYYFEPADKEDTVQILGYLQHQGVSFLALGKGSNVLVSDSGFRGAVVNIETVLKSMHGERNRVYTEAGVTLNRFVDFCIQRGLKGVEMLAGIPGTIGGAVIMNAGAYGGEISNYLNDIEILRAGTQIVLKKDEIGFSYRHASLQEHDVILSANFELPEGNREELFNRRNDLILQRNRKHPVNYPNCGSVFKNPKTSPAAKFVEDAGLKGVRSGAAQISERHGNFIVNLGGATAEDVMTLIRLIQKTVCDQFQILLEPEVKLIGFSDALVQGTVE